MIVVSSFLDHELAGRLEEIVKDKAGTLGLKYDGLTLGPKDDLPMEFSGVGEEILVRYDDGRVILMFDTGQVRNIHPDAWERIIEHELCHCKDMEEGVYLNKVFIFGEPDGNRFYPLVMEMDKSYSDYFCSQRQIDVFGLDNFREFHTRGLEEFFGTIDKVIMDSEKIRGLVPDARTNQYFVVFGLFKEYIKSSLIDYESPLIKEPIMDISKMLIEGFEAINSTDAGWIDKTKMLFYTGLALSMEYALVDSYLEGRLLRTGRPGKDRYLSALAGNLGLESDCSATLGKIGNIFG